MPRFFVPSDNITGEYIRITGSDAAHITRSLRMATGEAVTVCNMKCTEYGCVIDGFEDGDVVLRIVSSAPGKTEPPYRVTVYQALPKGDKMETIVQKTVETGAYKIVPFVSERCISRPDGKAKLSKVERWNKISLEAAKQCGRGRIPEVGEILGFTQMLDDATKADTAILFYEGDGTVPLNRILKEVGREENISVIIGSEGGFSLDEVGAAKDRGILIAGLGPRILRCETAPTVALSAISYALEL